MQLSHCVLNHFWTWILNVFVCVSQDQGAKHQILSRSSSEPSQPTFQSKRTRNRWHTEGNRPEHDETDTELGEDDDADTHWDGDDETEDERCTQEKPAGRGTAVRGSLGTTPTQEPVENQTHSQTLDTEREEEEESTDTLRWVLYIGLYLSSDLWVITTLNPFEFQVQFLNSHKTLQGEAV